MQAKLRVKQAEDILRQRNLELETVQETSQQLARSETYEEIADALLSHINRVVDVTWARVDIGQESDFVFSCLKIFTESTSSSFQLFQDQYINLEVLSPVIADHCPLLIDNTHLDQSYHVYEEAGVSSLAVVPLICRNRLNGVLSVSNSLPGQYTKAQISLLQTIASLAALAIENVQNLENKSQIVQEMNQLKTYLSGLRNDVNCQALLEHLPLLSKQMSGEIS
jgi:GAF domain-containing protein